MARAKEKLDYTALRQALRTQGPERLYLLWGVEDYLIRDFTHQVREVCLGGRRGILTAGVWTGRPLTRRSWSRPWPPCRFCARARL